jgi:hypothetical protein
MPPLTIHSTRPNRDDRVIGKTYATVMNCPDPFTLPGRKALHREASLVRQLIASGATALGRASYGNGFGEYYTAFFGPSIGIERLAKLILVAVMQWTMEARFLDQLLFGNTDMKLGR